MPTKRIPIGRQPAPKITVKAIRLFEAMRRCRCTCPEDRELGTRCDGCERWWSLNNDLCDELHTPLWQYPCVQNPLAENPYPLGCAAYKSWKPDREAQATWKALVNASCELRRAQRKATRPRRTPVSSLPPEPSPAA
jgi:hypothetical protein